VPIPADKVRDPFEELVKGFDLGRDPERVPIRWDDGPDGGFTTGEPWLPLGDPARNVTALRKDPASLLNLYRELMGLRRKTACLMRGDYHPMRAVNDVLAYRRSLGQEEILVLLNIAQEPRRWNWQGQGNCLLSTDLLRERGSVDGALQLGPNEGLIIAVNRA
jgi:alpha-glucosidase